MSQTLSAELKAVHAPAAWMRWAEQRDREIRARLVQGDVDSLVNFMLFGTSFTSRPRITLAALTEFARKVSAAQAAGSPEAVAFAQALQDRAMDLINAMTQPSANERVLYGRRLIESQGIDIKTAAGREAAKSYLIKNLSRVVGENEGYTRVLESARVMGDASGEFVERSKLFRDRGLSSDTSLMPNFAIEKSLAAMKSRGLLAAGSVRRVAIIGPGLDFTDKQDGYDFYPQQTTGRAQCGLCGATAARPGMERRTQGLLVAVWRSGGRARNPSQSSRRAGRVESSRGKFVSGRRPDDRAS
jgi:hypothetical protein